VFSVHSSTHTRHEIIAVYLVKDSVFARLKKENCASQKTKTCYLLVRKLSKLVSLTRKKQNLEWSLRNISPLLLSLLKKATHDDFQIIAMYGEAYFNLEFVEMTMIVKIFPNNPITRNVNRSKAENIIPV